MESTQHTSWYKNQLVNSNSFYSSPPNKVLSFPKVVTSHHPFALGEMVLYKAKAAVPTDQ